MTHTKLIIALITIGSLLFVFACSSSKQKNVSNTTTFKNKAFQDSLAFELCKIYGSDQGIRDIKIMKSPAFKLSPYIDSVNFYKMMDFVKQYGVPNKKLLGEKNYSQECVEGAFIAVLLHTPHILIDNDNKEYLDILLAEVEKGNMNIKFLTDVLDKHYWIKRDEFGNRRLLYGSQFGKPCRMYRKESDSARAVIGLLPLPDSSFVDCKTN